jgi:hypothetical protein
VGLVIGVLSYNGNVFWGFNADYDRMPDLAEFRRAINSAFERLVEASGARERAEPAEIPAVAGTIGPRGASATPVPTSEQLRS